MELYGTLRHSLTFIFTQPKTNRLLDETRSRTSTALNGAGAVGEFSSAIVRVCCFLFAYSVSEL